ncbi:MAG: phosphopantetheine-binding protein [Candidatus Onthovivens sp.]|nr:phosphopantetheine-binding protein [Candidatus Onthovivens sp.]
MNKYESIVKELQEKLNLTTLDEGATLASLGLDSLDVVEFILDVEDNYDIKFESSETQDIKTLGDLLKVIKSKCE